MSTVLVLSSAAATLMLTGLIWFVQVVHYPLFRRIGASDFVAYENAHTRATSFVVVPLMLIELVTAVLIPLVSVPPLSSVIATAALLPVVLIWISTFAIQVPLHRKLSLGHDGRAIDRLIRTNYVRTVLWSSRSFLMIYIVTEYYV